MRGWFIVWGLVFACHSGGGAEEADRARESTLPKAGEPDGAGWSFATGAADTRTERPEDPRVELSPDERQPERQEPDGPPPHADPLTPSLESRPDVWDGQVVLVAPAPGVSARQLARELGVTVREPVGPSGFALLTVPEGASAGGFSLRLAAHPMVANASRMARIRGSDFWSIAMLGRANRYQWHLASAQVPLGVGEGLRDVIVAVLDTGVAYEDHVDGDQVYARAETLAGVSFVAPADFVNGDDHANDDHGHGTHIASLIASEGRLEGVAPGVSLMPVKVLDENNAGTELALVEGIRHAVDHGADIINMSLSFPSGYVPSRALKDALEYAHTAGVVMVAASGNQGLEVASWPAASRLVVGVGAVAPHEWPLNVSEVDYANRWNGLDVVAPGGDLDADRTYDGLPDGMLAETIRPGDPSVTEDWLLVGTSQAAAVVSGAAAWLLEGGAHPREVPWLLQSGAHTRGLDAEAFEGLGAGTIQLSTSLEDLEDGDEVEIRKFSVGLLPFVRSKDDQLAPKARVWVVEPGEDEALDVEVLGTLFDATGAHPVRCAIRDTNTCDLEGAPRPDDGRGVFSFTVDGVVARRIAYRPTPALFATEGLEIVLQALAAESSLESPLLGFRLSAGHDERLGPVADSYLVVNTGSGMLSSPLGLVMQPGAYPWRTSTQPVDLQGSGLVSVDLGTVTADVLPLPLGRVVAMDPRDLAEQGLDLHPADVFGPDSTSGSGMLSSPLGFQGELVDLGRRAAEVDLGSCLLGAALEGGGFVTPAGDDAVNQLIGSGAFSRHR